MPIHSNPARARPRFPGPHEQEAAGGYPSPAAPEPDHWTDTLQRRCDQAALLIVLFAAAWFGSGSIGATLP